MAWEKIEGMTFERAFIEALGTEIDIPRDVTSNATTCPHEDEYLCADVKRPKYTGHSIIDGVYTAFDGIRKTIKYLPHLSNAHNLYHEELENIEGKERLFEQALVGCAKVYSGTFVHDYREQMAVVDRDGDVFVYVRNYGDSLKNADLHEDIRSSLSTSALFMQDIQESTTLNDKAFDLFGSFVASLSMGTYLAQMDGKGMSEDDAGMVDIRYRENLLEALWLTFKTAIFAESNYLSQLRKTSMNDPYCEFVLDSQIDTLGVDANEDDLHYCFEKQLEEIADNSYWTEVFKMESEASICPLLDAAEDYVNSLSVKFTPGEVDQWEMARNATNRMMDYGETYYTSLVGNRVNANDSYSISVVGERIF